MKETYEILLPPHKLDYDNWDKLKADSYLIWFQQHAPERARYVLEKAHITNREEPIAPEVLKKVWKWFLNNVCTIEYIPEEEYDRIKVIYKKFGEKSGFLERRRLSVFTEYVITDIAMLMSWVWLENAKSLYWGIDYRPKNLAFLNQPAIKGFIDSRSGKPFQLSFVPVNMVHVQAVKAIKNRANDNDLYNLYMQWSKFVPN